MKAAAPAAGTGFFGLRAKPPGGSYRAAVLAAPGGFSRDVVATSSLVELYDEELDVEPHLSGILTERVPPSRIASRLKEHLSGGVFACLIGYPSFPAALTEAKGYRHVLISPGTPAAGGIEPDLIIGLRRGRAAGAVRKKPITAREIATGSTKGRIRKVPGAPFLLTVDPQVMDPALFPVRGNIEPGGLQWYRLTEVLRAVLRGRCVAVLITPCRLPAADDVPAFIAARLVAKILAYALSAD